jgi:PIN domain nuclease of toxin-antitoxin system
MTIVLDTCALIWWTLDPEKLSSQALQAIHVMEQEKNGLVASISLWEIAIKVQKGKLDLGCSVSEYLALLRRVNCLKIIDIDVDLWLASVTLDWSHRDPADRLIVALAQRFDASLLTGDRQILDFYPEAIF